MFYKINDIVNSQILLFETDNTVDITNIPNIPSTSTIEGIPFIVTHDTLDNINSTLNTVKNNLLNRENHRFSLCKLTLLDNIDQWSTFNENDAPEINDYAVFNQDTGVHEVFHTLTNALTRQTEIKNNFLISCNLNTLEIIDRNTFFKPIPVKKSQPTSTGTQTL